jgi:uncharacterized protein (DUF1697 family)
MYVINRRPAPCEFGQAETANKSRYFHCENQLDLPENIKTRTYVALLRGINVGGHHKVPMADLRTLMGKLGFGDVTTLLASGNVIFTGQQQDTRMLEKQLAADLEKHFGFPIPVLIRTKEQLLDLAAAEPFRDIEVTKDIRRYVSFLMEKPNDPPTAAWKSDDGSFEIKAIYEREVISVLDLSKTKTTKHMDMLGKQFGKDITTRNWNTVEKIVRKF